MPLTLLPKLTKHYILKCSRRLLQRKRQRYLCCPLVKSHNNAIRSPRWEHTWVYLQSISALGTNITVLWDWRQGYQLVTGSDVSLTSPWHYLQPTLGPLLSPHLVLSSEPTPTAPMLSFLLLRAQFHEECLREPKATDEPFAVLSHKNPLLCALLHWLLLMSKLPLLTVFPAPFHMYFYIIDVIEKTWFVHCSSVYRYCAHHSDSHLRVTNSSKALQTCIWGGAPHISIQGQPSQLLQSNNLLVLSASANLGIEVMHNRIWWGSKSKHESLLLQPVGQADGFHWKLQGVSSKQLLVSVSSFRVDERGDVIDLIDIEWTGSCGWFWSGTLHMPPCACQKCQLCRAYQSFALAALPRLGSSQH